MTTPADNGSDLLRELEESIPQGRVNSTRPTAADDFDDLDAMMEETLGIDRKEKEYQEDLKQRKRGFSGMSKEEVAFCNSRMAAFEAARIWFPRRNIAVFTKFTCSNCGDQAMMFSRWMQEQQSRREKTSWRWTPAAEPSPSLPNISAYEERPTALCVYCARIAGIETHELVKLDNILNHKEQH